MSPALANVYGNLLLVRPPPPATVNKAGANYKSEVPHLTYSPRRAYDEWLSICDAIVASGGDALFDFEPEDDALLDRGDLLVAPDGSIRAASEPSASAPLAHLDDVLTGRVFAANGPFVIIEGTSMRALLPHMLPHRAAELAYYRRLLSALAAQGNYTLDLHENPHRWEGMADVAPVVRDDGSGPAKVVLTFTVPGHYDEGLGAKTLRSSREGSLHAADFARIPAEQRIFAELVYPHFHGDTVHFGARPIAAPHARDGVLVHYPGGLWAGPDSAEPLRNKLAPAEIVTIDRTDAVEHYAANSRQVNAGLLVPEGVSPAFIAAMEALGLTIHRLALFELFGKAGGGPACATLYLPKNLALPPDSPLRYSVRREEARARRDRIAERLVVDPAFFEGRARG